MTHIQRFFWLYLLSLSALWFGTAPNDWANLPNFLAWRSELIQYSGVLGMGVMSLAMLLALRPVWLEPRLGGLDKIYRLHKWLGIAGLSLSVGHWLLAQGPKWLVGLGWLERPARGPRPTFPEGSWQAFFQQQRGLAESLGEWAFYAAALLMVLALIKRLPYRQFVKTHHWIAAAYLVLVVHAVVLLRFDDWASALGLVMALLMAGGTVAAVRVLSGRVGSGRRLGGAVVGLREYPALNVLEVEIALRGHWAGHQPGQFAFVTLHEQEGAHPYTISSNWRGDGRLSFLIKGLGDYTATLAQQLQPGDQVQVEGPYGRFNFAGQRRRQIWVGAGIGITPFLARMQALAHHPDGKHIDLLHPTTVLDDQAIGRLRQDAEAAKVRLQVFWEQRDGRLDAQRIAALVPDWRDADIWFCGPAGFGQALRQGFAALGLAPGRFHQELFEMR